MTRVAEPEPSLLGWTDMKFFWPDPIPTFEYKKFDWQSSKTGIKSNLDALNHLKTQIIQLKN